jgi:hypothetical protein
MAELGWIDVSDSDRIIAMAYDEVEEAIYVRFPKSEVEWCYEACPPNVWDEFSAAGQSKGQYIHETLNHKPNHRHE